MTINEDTLKGKWAELKGEIQKTWGNLTEDEVTKTNGDLKAIAGLVQQKYGEDKAAFEAKLAKMMIGFNTKKEEVLKAVKTNLKSI